MYLCMIDKDTSYRAAFEHSLLLTNDNKLIFSGFSSLEEWYEQSKQKDVEVVIADIELLNPMTYSQLVSDWKGLLIILCEQTIYEASQQWVVEIQQVNKEHPIYLLPKYQKIEQLYTYIKRQYIELSNCFTPLISRSTEIIALYSPYGNSKQSEFIENSLATYVECNKQSLLIHYDPFYRIEHNNGFNLSLLFSKISHNNNALTWITSEICRKRTPSLDCIDGPIHMFDIDYMDQVNTQRYIAWLKKDSNYDRIVINFNGVHLSSHIFKILESSDTCVLLTEDERIQKHVLKQFNVKWNLQSGNIDNLMKEVFGYRKNGLERTGISRN